MTDALPLPQRNPVVSDFLALRRSNSVKTLGGDAPLGEELADILRTAARVPDHRKLFPWRFLVIAGEARARAGELGRAAFVAKNPNASDVLITAERTRFERAPLVIAVISAPVTCPKGTPEWEQVLSAGVVCYNLVLAAQSRGYGANWLTEWVAYDPDVLRGLGVAEAERVAGYIHIGQTERAPYERPRPDMALKVSHF